MILTTLTSINGIEKRKLNKRTLMLIQGPLHCGFVIIPMHLGLYYHSSRSSILLKIINNQINTKLTYILIKSKSSQHNQVLLTT